MGRPITKEVRSLKFLGDRTRNGCKSCISLPAWGLQLIQIISCRSGTQSCFTLLSDRVGVTLFPFPPVRLPFLRRHVSPCRPVLAVVRGLVVHHQVELSPLALPQRQHVPADLHAS